MDETGVPLDPPKQRVCAKQGQRKVSTNWQWQQVKHYRSRFSQCQGTHSATICDFEGKNFNHGLTEGKVPGTTYGIDMELFKHWFAYHFLRHAAGARPLLLLMNGHGSNYQPEIIQRAREVML